MWRKTVIDLTALLDVILIMLYFVLANAGAAAAQTRQDAAGLAEENAALTQQLAQTSQENQALAAALGGLTGENESLEDQLAGFSFLRESCLVIRIYVTGGEDQRTVHVEAEDSTQTFPLTWDNAASLRPALKEELARLIQGAENSLAVFLLFRYDAGSIYRADYEWITGVMEQVRGEYPALHYAQYDTTQEIAYEIP